MANSNSKEALNLYAKVEDLLGIKEYAPKLYSYYFEILDSLKFNSLLDIGCGSGEFLREITKRYSVDAEGIDRSNYMVKLTKKAGLKASTLELNEINRSYDIATATFDMVNYLTPQEFIEFFSDLKSVIKSGGYFIFDVNTEFGLSDLAVGNFIAEDKNRFLAIESFYEDGLYESNFTLFEKENSFYKKSKESINQYYYNREFFELLSSWKIIKELPINLYELGSADKVIYIFKRV